MLTRCTGHWYPQAPVRGQALRSVIYDPAKGDIDDLLLAAAESIGISSDKLSKSLAIPKGAKFCQVWTDPGLVEVTYGPSQSIILYRQQQFSPVAPAFNPYNYL
ncbi:MAG: hypothetical protein Q8P67_14880 [archaeon]|nr:hypothetical protein [archaeon]